jgi:hypothetical protein
MRPIGVAWRIGAALVGATLLCGPTLGETRPERFIVPGTGFEIPLGPSVASSAPPSLALVVALGKWIAATTDLRLVSERPAFRFAPGAMMAELRYGRILAGAKAGAMTGSDPRSPSPDIVAFYDRSTKTIYLADDWSGGPVHLSVLVHEMVHHFQNVNGLRYPCPEAREHLAYLAQNRWLELFGSNLEAEFGFDRLTMLVKTNCIH